MKTLFFVFTLAAILFLSGCGAASNTPAGAAGLGDVQPGSSAAAETPSEAPQGVSARVTEASAAGLTLELSNATEEGYIFSSDFRLDKKTGDAWLSVPVVVKGNYGFNDIAYELPAGASSEWFVDWEWLYGKPDAGEYRITKTIFVIPYKPYDLSAEFRIP